MVIRVQTISLIYFFYYLSLNLTSIINGEHMRNFVSCLVEPFTALFNLDIISSRSGRHLISKPLPGETSGKSSF